MTATKAYCGLGSRVALIAALVCSPLLQAAALPENDGPPVLRVTTYNIRSCEGLDGHYDCGRIARVLRSTRPDVIALQEVRAEQAGEIARDLGFQFVFARADRVHGYEFGNAILTRFPVVASHIYPIGVPHRQQRACLRVDIAWPRAGETIHIYTVHFGLKKWERESQAMRMVSTEILTDPAFRSGPQILMGDFNEKLGGGYVHRHISKLMRGTRKWSWPAFLPLFSLDHIYYNSCWRMHSAHAGAGALAFLIASDHAPVAATLAEISPDASSAH